MLTALQWVASGGEQSLPEATAAEHLALTEGHVPEVIAGGDRNPKLPPSSRSRTWTSALSTGSTLTWSPTEHQGAELRFRLLSHPRICNKPNPLSQFA